MGGVRVEGSKGFIRLLKGSIRVRTIRGFGFRVWGCFGLRPSGLGLEV